MATTKKSSVYDRLLSWVESWQRHRRSGAELDGFGTAELEHIASDLGLSAKELRSLSRCHPGASTLLPSRLQQLGLDPEGVRMCEPATYRDLERVCARCRSSGRCERDLARNDAEAGMRGYCPNAPTIDALMADPWSQPRAGPETVTRIK